MSGLAIVHADGLSDLRGKVKVALKRRDLHVTGRTVVMIVVETCLTDRDDTRVREQRRQRVDHPVRVRPDVTWMQSNRRVYIVIALRQVNRGLA